MFWKEVLCEETAGRQIMMAVFKLNKPAINHLLAGFRDTDMLAIPTKPSSTLKTKMKNPIAWVLVHISNMLITVLSATIFNPIGVVTGFTSENGVLDRSVCFLFSGCSCVVLSVRLTISVFLFISHKSCIFCETVFPHRPAVG